MAVYSQRLLPEVIRFKDAADITSSYTAIGTASNSPVGSPLLNPSRIFNLSNQTDALLYFSFDGLNNHLVLPAKGFILLDVVSNKTLATGCFVAQGEVIYVKQNGVPTTGSVYLMTFYGAN